MVKLSDEKLEKKYAVLPILGISRLKLHDLWYIISRNLFLFINGVIFSVVALLFIFGDRRAALFLGIISFINVIAGLFQDINAWLALEKLQLLTAPRVTRINPDGSLGSVLTEEIEKGNRLKLKIGDQVPVDSILIEAHSFEINEGLLTGESDSLPRSTGDHLLAGSVVTSGLGIVKTEAVFHESRIARMTEGIKRYSVNLSPIQCSINTVVKYAGYLLIAVIIFIVARGILAHQSGIQIVNSIGAITIVLVPAGLVFAATLLFAYGAAHLFRRQVLLQEVNATEKLGRIKNLCMDKTGTLTENALAVENMHVPSGIEPDFAKEMAAAYIQGTGDSTQTIEAVKKFIAGNAYEGRIIEALTFSSWRQYGAVRIGGKKNDTSILVGSPDIFLPYILKNEEKEWLQKILGPQARQGKHVLCVMQAENGSVLPQDISQVSLSVIAIFVFYNNLREGIRDTVDFFQNRGVRIRIISGDNRETVKAVAASAGVKDTDKIITGKEMEEWGESDFDEKTKQYAIFARIAPEQKEKIISALKKDGFTAMVGDGANDALAIKKADLGIAMFDGAPATRQLASVVLMNNSFAALPGGVELADSVIRNLEIFSSIFFNISLTGFFFFIAVSLLGYAYPFSPLNTSLINYIAIGIPGTLISYWVILPSGKVRPASAHPFLVRIFPFTISSSIIQAFGLAAVFALSLGYSKIYGTNLPVLLSFIAFGFIFFTCAPQVYVGALKPIQKKQLWLLGIIESLILVVIFKVPILSSFFNITKAPLPLSIIFESALILCLLGYVQYKITKGFVLK
jgi:cation-transporting P-type ATPase E